jgi:hypothetical protein
MKIKNNKNQMRKNIQSGRRFNVCQDIDCHEHLLTEQEIRSGFCQSHGGIISDKEFEDMCEFEHEGCIRCGSHENFYINDLGVVRHTLYCSVDCDLADRAESAEQEAMMEVDC